MHHRCRIFHNVVGNLQRNESVVLHTYYFRNEGRRRAQSTFFPIAAIGRGCVKTLEESRSGQKMIKNRAPSLNLSHLHCEISPDFAYGHQLLDGLTVFTQPRPNPDLKLTLAHAVHELIHSRSHL